MGAEIARLRQRVARAGLTGQQAAREVLRRLGQARQQNANQRVIAPRPRVNEGALVVYQAPKRNVANVRVAQPAARASSRAGNHFAHLHHALTGSPLVDNPLFKGAQVAAYRSPAYNVFYALGHHEGPMPLPQVDAMTNPDTYTGAVGTVSYIVQVPPGQNYAFVLCPYSQYPIAVCRYNPSERLVNSISMDDNIAWANDPTAPQNGAGTYAPFGIPFTDSLDPRTMVSGAQGPHFNDFDPTDATPTAAKPVRAQFMGGQFSVECDAAYNATGVVVVLDSKSFPTTWGSKVASADMHGDEPTFVNTPNESSYLKLYNSPLFGGVGLNYQGSGVNKSLIGGGPAASVHIGGILPPDGQKWAVWSGAFTGAGPGSGYAGNAAAFNWYSCMAQGFPLMLVGTSAGGGPVNVTIRGRFAYNVTLPTTGTGAVSVLAQRSPTLMPHTSPVSKIHAVIQPHHGKDESTYQHRIQTASRTDQAGLPITPQMISDLKEIQVGTARHVESAGSQIWHSVTQFGARVGSAALREAEEVGARLAKRGVQMLATKAEEALFA